MSVDDIQLPSTFIYISNVQGGEKPHFVKIYCFEVSSEVGNIIPVYIFHNSDMFVYQKCRGSGTPRVSVKYYPTCVTIFGLTLVFHLIYLSFQACVF